MVIGCINCHQGIKFVCMNIPLIGWSGLLNIGRERSFVCSESKYVDQLMCGREFVYVCCACCVDEIVSSILITIGLPFFLIFQKTQLKLHFFVQVKSPHLFISQMTGC